MQESIVSSLLGARQNLRTIWEKQLWSEPIRSPIANPDALIYLMEWTLNEFFARLRNETNLPVALTETVSPSIDIEALCSCGGNPFLSYFGSAHKAVISWTESTRSPLAGLSDEERGRCVRELLWGLETVARREIESFCSVCRYQNMNRPLDRGKCSLYPAGSGCGAAVACRP